LNLLLISAALGITLFASDGLRLLTLPAFYPAAKIVPVVLIAYIFQSWTGMQDVGIHLRERTEFITLANWIAALVAIAGYMLLIPRWLGWGAAIATVLSFGVRYLIILRVSLRFLPVHYQWTPVFRIIGLALGAALLSIAEPAEGIATSLAIRAAIFVLYVAAVWRAGVLTDDERSAVRDFIASRLSFSARATADLPPADR
jgi:O-antigen/teichoic acid export membrane protein